MEIKNVIAEKKDLNILFKDSRLIQIVDGKIVSIETVRDYRDFSTFFGIDSDFEQEDRIRMLFADRFRMARKELGLTQTQLADSLYKKTGVSLTNQMISKMECGDRYPSLSNLIALCRFFNMSADYLLGYCERKPLLSSSSEPENFNTRFSGLMRDLNLSSREFSEKLEAVTDGKVRRTDVYAYAITRGMQTANVSVLPYMAEVFGCSIDTLIGF